MTTKNPVAASSIEDLLVAVEEDEQLQLCDELARGDKTAAAVDAALGQASPRLQRVRQMSEPLTAEQKDRLVALLLQPAPAQPTLAVVSGAAATPKPAARRTRTMGFFAAGLAIAASVAVYVSWPRDKEQLPVLALEVAEHNSAVLGAPTPAEPAGVQVHPRSCLDLRLRPERSYSGELQTAVWFVADRADAAQKPVPWPVQLRRVETGLLQLDTCAPLPSEVGPGSWQLAVFYGDKLPTAAEAGKVLATPAAGIAEANWHIARQPLQVVAAPP